jgi:thiamine-monophosphate kinase
MRASGEFEVIRRFTAHFEAIRGSSVGAPSGGASSVGLVLGPGDDCAVLQPRPGWELAITTDAVREGIHFGPLFRPEEIGHKALAVNLSDLAAMGARPRWFLVALELPAALGARTLDGIARGMARLARAEGIVLAGGNITLGDRLGLTLTAIGEVRPGALLRRDGLRPGDSLAVTGTLGEAALGLRRLQAGTRRGAGAQLRPVARVAAGLALLGIATCAIDVSDGLAQDLSHLCRRSGCGAELWIESLPRRPAVAREQDWLGLCLSGGEDYELLFGFPPARLRALRTRLARLGVPLSIVGRATTGGGVLLRPWAGAPGRPLEAEGFQHLW